MRGGENGEERKEKWAEEGRDGERRGRGKGREEEGRRKKGKNAGNERGGEVKAMREGEKGWDVKRGEKRARKWSTI